MARLLSVTLAKRSMGLTRTTITPIVVTPIRAMSGKSREPPGAYNMGLGDISRVFVTMGKEGAKHDKGLWLIFVPTVFGCLFAAFMIAKIICTDPGIHAPFLPWKKQGSESYESMPDRMYFFSLLQTPEHKDGFAKRHENFEKRLAILEGDE